METTNQTETRTCTECKGAGTRTSPACVISPTYTIPERTRVCTGCWGLPTFYKPVPRELMEGVSVAIKGTDNRRFRKSAPPVSTRKSVLGRRVYYVWRLAMFHGGQDVRMPMEAELICSADPFHDDLALVAQAVAEKVFGTHMAGVNRWARAMGVL